MNDNKKLIEEAAKAIRDLDAEFDFNNGDDPRERYDALIHGFARAALAVFEKAHTPTDDEREALRVEVERIQRAVWAEIHGQDPTRKYSVAEVKQLVYSFDNVLSTLICGSVVPQERAERDWAEYRDEAPENNTPDQRRAFFAALCNSEVTEPSDARVRSVATAIRVAASENLWTWRDLARAALRAAGGVR